MFIRDLPPPKAQPRSLILTSLFHRSLIFSQSSTDWEQRALRETAGTTLFSLPPLFSLKAWAALDFPVNAWGQLKANQRTGRRTHRCTTSRLVQNVTLLTIPYSLTVYHCYPDNDTKVSLHCGCVPNHTIIIMFAVIIPLRVCPNPHSVYEKHPLENRDGQFTGCVPDYSTTCPLWMCP